MVTHSRLYDHLSLPVLKLLSSIGAEGSLSRAAALLHVVPSAASRRVKQLEDVLGVALLRRTSRGAELTPAGLAIARSAQKIIADVDRLDEELRDLQSGVTGHVRLVASISAIVQHLPQDLARFLARHGSVRVDLEEHASAEIVERLLNGQADVGVYVAVQESPGLTLFPYRSERLAVILPTGHHLASHASLRFSQLLDEDWVGLPAGTALADLLVREAQRLGARLRTRIQVKGMDSACRMVQSGLGVGLLPQAGLEQQARFSGLVAVPLDETWAERRSVVAVNSRADLPTACLALVDALTKSDE